MAKIKLYTDLEQSKKLAEILPLESADMSYKKEFITISLFGEPIYDYKVKPDYCEWSNLCESIPCWSLAALLNVLSEIKPEVYTPILFPSEGKWILQFAEYGHGNICEVTCDNPVDACYEMILKLHELNLL